LGKLKALRAIEPHKIIAHNAFHWTRGRGVNLALFHALVLRRFFRSEGARLICGDDSVLLNLKEYGGICRIERREINYVYQAQFIKAGVTSGYLLNIYEVTYDNI
jgi:hypothetical protein